MPGRRILVDASSSDLQFGTGVSTYSRTLGRALAAMGENVAWLSGRPAPARPDPLVDQVMLHDRPRAGGGLRQALNTGRLMWRGLTTPAMAPRAVAETGAVVGSGSNGARVFLAPELFEVAHYRHMLLRDFCELRINEKMDVLHLTAPLPIRMKGVRVITTVHDLVPIRLPGATTDNKDEFIRRIRSCVRNSDLVFTVSEASRNDILDLLQAPPEKVVTTYQSTDLLPLPASETDSIPRVLARFGLDPGKYVLWVGAIEPKKNLRRLIEAFVEIDADIPLVMVGQKAWMWESQIADLEQVLGPARMKRLRFLGYVEREDLRRLYAGAMLFAFPSLYEGFGLPALEAMVSGCPVIASNSSSLPEICGEAALYADPNDRDDLRRQLEKLIGDAGLRARLVSAGHRQAEKFSFQNYVAALGRAYSKLS